MAAIASVVVCTGVIATAGRSADAKTVSRPLRAFVSRLPVASEQRAGYVRSKFHHWVDADHDRCDTRREVLIAEAVKKPKVGASCSLTGGRWHSQYDDLYGTNASTFDIDHVVPLAEAWDSGASAWTASQREAFANDLSDPRALIAVSASSNRSKGDRDPAEWLPPNAAFRCHYVRDWVAVKVRWQLSVDKAEKKTLVALAAGCAAVVLKIPIAGPGKPTTPPTTKPKPPPTTKPSNCSAAYPDFCIPPPPPDLNCADVAPHHNFRVLAPDPHRFDSDNDGLGCES